jgi:Zn finger protein HypA/HybF involved in hydrogenase expression
MKTELSLIKIKCTKDMIGKDILIPATEISYNNINSLDYGINFAALIKYKGRHNLERHDLFFACCKLVAENLGDKHTITSICEHVKIDARHIEGYVTYQDKDDKNRVNVLTKSIGFFEMTLQEADEFYSKAFDILASYINVEVDVLVHEAKKRMLNKKYCPVCGNIATHKHHKFSQTKWAKEKYGKKLIDHEFNIEYYCPDCHTSHARILKAHLWTEKKFVEEAKKGGLL